MHAGSQERRRQFYGWGYEGDEVSPQEVVEFEKAWTRRLADFTAVPFPTEDSINLRPSRVKVPASLQAICTTDNTTASIIPTARLVLTWLTRFAANSGMRPFRNS
jgi:hypothetical protein